MPEINEKYIEYLVGRGLVGADIDLNKTLNDEAYRNDLFSKIQTKTNNIYGSIDQFNHDLYGSGDNEFTKNRYIVGGSQSALRAKNKERAFPGVGGTTPLTTDIKPVVAPSQGEESQMRGGINEFSSALEQKAKGLNQKDKADVKEFEGLANLELQSASQQFETIYPQSEDIFNKATKLQMDAVSKRKELEDLLTSPEATAKQEEISRLRKSIESNNNEYARITKSTEYLEKQDEIHKLTSEAKSVNESLLATKGKISEQFGNDWEDKIISVAPIISEFSELMIKSDLTNDVTEKKILESEANRFIEENKDAITYFNDVVGNPLYKEYQSQADIYNKTTSDFDQRIKQKTSELYTRFPQLNELTQKDRQLRSRYQQVQKAYNSTIGAKQEKYGKELAKLKKQFEEINPTLTAIYESPEYADLQRAKEYIDTAKKAIEIAAPSDYSKMLEKRQQTTDLENRLPTQESLQRINPVTNSVVGAVSNFLGSIAQGSIATTSTVLDATLDGLGADDLRTWVRNGSYEALSGVDASINYLDAATRPSNQRRVYAEKIKINDNLFAVVDGNNVQAFTDKEGYDVKGDEKSYKQAQKLLKEGAKPKGEIDISSAAWETLNQATMMASYLYGGIGMSSVFGKLGALSRSSNLTRLGLSMAGENAITSGIGMQVFSQSLARGILDNKDPLENVTNATIGAALEMTLGKALGNVESKVSKMYLNKGSIDNFLSLSTSRKILLNKGLSTKQKIKEIGSLMAKDLPNGVKEAFLENVEELGIDPLTQAGTSAIFGGDVSLPSFSESMNIVIPTTLMVAGGDAVGLGGKYRMLNKGAALASIYSQIPNKLDPSSITDFFNQGMGKLTEGLSEEDLKKLPNIDEISKETSGLFNKVEEYKQENNLIDEDFDALRLGTLFNLLAAKSRVESLADDATDIGEQEKYTGDLETIDAELNKLAKDIEDAPPTSEGLTPKESAFNPDRIAIEKSKEKDTTVAEINATTEEDYTDAINQAIEKETDPFATLEDEIKTKTITDKEPTPKTSDAAEIKPQEDVKETNKIEAAVIEVDGKLYEGKNHAEAILKAQADGKDISQVNRQEQGKFRLSDGTIIDRAEAKKQFGQDRSELIIPQDENANQANKDYAKYKKDNEQEVPITPIKPVEQGQQNNDGTRLSETAKEEVEGVSGSALKDVVRQESDAEKLNKEAGVDIYVARQDIDTNGGKYTLSQIKENGNTNTFLIEDAKGNEVGKAQLSANGNYLENIRIDEKHRRKGLASKVYDFIELRKGIELEPSPNKQSKEAKALWDKRNLQKSVSNKANGGLLAKALGESMSKAFSDFRKKQEVLLELENRYFKQKGLSREDFNKLSESDKADVIKDAVKWKNENPELVKAVESLLSKEQTPAALKDVESTAKDDPDLKNIDPTIIAARSGDKQAQKKLEKYGLDWEQTTTYRFVGQSEVDVLLSNNKVESKRGMADAGIDVTTSPKVTSAASNEYRVTFKESFDVNNGLGKVKSKSKEESDHHLEKGRGYDINDVAKIEKIDEKGNVVETIYESAPTQYTEAAGGSALKDVESTAKALEDSDFKTNTPIKGLSVRMSDLRIAEDNLSKGKKSITPNEPIDVTINLTTGNRELSDGYHRYLDARGGTIEKAKTRNLEGSLPAKIKFEINEKSSGFVKTREATNKEISEAYHKAKADGSNPELVKAVEELLGKPKESTPQAGSVVGGEVEETKKKLESVSEDELNKIPDWVSTKEQETKEKVVTLKDGSEIRLQYLYDNTPDNLVAYILGFNKNNDQVSTVMIEKGNDGRWKGNDLSVDKKYRRKGLASEMYDFADEQGHNLTPTKSLKPDGIKFWNNRNKNRAKFISEAYHKAKADGSNPELVKAVEDLINKNESNRNTTTEVNPKAGVSSNSNEGNSALRDVETKQQIENFGVPKEDVDATHGLLNQVFSGLKKAGLTAAKTVSDWVGIGKGEANPNSLDGIVEAIQKTLPKVENKETVKEQPKTESEIPTWIAEFERTKTEKDLVKMEELYNKIKVVQNGVLQGRIKDPIVLEKTIKELNDLKKQIEDYAENWKKETQPKVSEVTETDTKKQPINKIEDLQDVGEKIGGAKKDLAQKLSDVTTEDLATKPLSKVFPKPDFKKLVEEGSLSEDGAILLNFLYEKIPAKPRKQYRVANWVKTVDSALQTTRQVLEAESTKNLDFTDKILKAVTLSETLKRDYKLYSDTMKGLGFPNNVVNLGGYEIKKFRGKRLDLKTGKRDEFESDIYSIVNGSSIVGDFKTMDDAINGLKTLLNKSEEKTKGTKFDIYQDRKTKEFFIGKKGAIDVVRIMQGFKTLGEARNFLKEKQSDIQGLWDAMKAPKERRMANRPRVGVDWRKGKNVDSKEFADTFGFRGVEFGNWVNNAERQSHVNEAYDALMDLSSVLGVSPKALSLNGELGFAFGARGSGKANAHYEAGKVVINLTKTRGAGSLAHEWWHALDNYFSRNRGQKESFITQSPRDRIERDGSRNQGVRKEMIDAFKSVMDAIESTKLSERSKVLDRARSDAYWSTNIEMSARSFENYIIQKLGERNQQNDYLANFKETAEWINDTKGDIDALKNYPYPLAEESPIVNEKFQQFFETIKEDESGKLFKDDAVEKSLTDIQSGKTFYEVVKENDLTDEQSTELAKELAESKTLPKKQFSKKDKIANDFDPNDNIDVKPIDKPIKTGKSKVESIGATVSKDEMRPAMKGVFHDAENGRMVTTDGMKMVIIEDKSIKKTEIIDPKTGNVIDAKFPNYDVVIPKDNPIKRKVNVKEWLSQLNGLAETKKFFDKPIAVRIKIGEQEFAFDSELMRDVFNVMAEQGITDVELQLSQPNRALVVESNKGVMGLVMPFIGGEEYRGGLKTLHKSEMTIAEKNGVVQKEIDYLESRKKDKQNDLKEAISEVRNAKNNKDLSSANFSVEYAKKRIAEIDAEIAEKKSQLIDNPLQEKQDLEIVKKSINNGEITSQEATEYVAKPTKRTRKAKQSIEVVESKAESGSETELNEAIKEADGLISGEIEEVKAPVKPKTNSGIQAQYRIESGKNIIEAIKDFNQSKNKARATVALTHEIMHPTVVSIIDGAKEGNEVGTKHTETIVNEFNKANPNNKVTVDELISGNDAFKDGTTSKQYRAVQEFIAKSWEQYHTEGGKGFSEAFQKVLDQITKAFQSVYKSLSGKELTPELRQMFDEILGKSKSLLSKEQSTSTTQSEGLTDTKVTPVKQGGKVIIDENGISLSQSELGNFITDGNTIVASKDNIDEVNKTADKTLPKSGALVFKNVLSKVLNIGSALGNPVIVHTGHDAMIKFLKENGDRAVGKINAGVFGYFDGTNYHVVLSENMNLGKTQYDVLLHEFLHPYISSILANNPQHFNALVTELLSDEALKKKYFDEFANPYDNRKKLEEALIEYLKDVASSKINENTIKAKGGFINAVKGFFKKLSGAKDIEPKVLYNTDMDLSSFANSLINAIVNTDIEYFKDLVNTKTQRELLKESDSLFNRLNDRLKAAVKNNRYLTFAAALRTGLINEEIPLDYDKIMEHPTWGNIFKLYNISPLVYENLLTIYNDDDVTKAVLEKVRANEIKKRDKVISDVTDVVIGVKDSTDVEIEHKPIVLGDTAIKIIDKLPTELQDKLKQAYTTRYAEATPLNFKEFLFPLIEKLADLFNGGDGTNPLSFEKMTLPQINNLIEGFSGLHNSLDIDQQVYALNYALKVAIMELTLRLDEKMYKDDKEKDDISRLIEDYTIRLSRQTTIASYVLAGVKNDMLPNRYKHLSLVSDIYDALLQGFSDFKGAKKTMDDIVGAFKEAKRQMAEEVKNQYRNKNNKGKPKEQKPKEQKPKEQKPKEQKPKEQKPPTDKKGKKDTPDRIKELADMIKAKKATESLSMTDYDKAEIELLHLLYTSTPLADIEAAYNNLTSSTNGKAILDEYLKTIDNSIQEYYAGTTNATLRDTLSKNGIPLSIVGDVATLIESAHKDLKSLLREKVYQANAKKITKIVIDKAKQLITDKLKDISNYTIHKAINKVYNTNVFDDYKADLLKSLGYIKASNTTVLNNLKKKRVILLNKQNPQSNRTKAEINKLDEEIKLKESIIAKADDTIQRITDSKNLNEINGIVSSIANEVKDITETSNRENARIYKTATETIKNAGLTESDILTELEQDGFSEASILSILSAAMGQKVPSKKVMVSISKAIDEIKTSSSPAHQKTVIRKINHILNESKITYSQQLIKRFFNHMTNSLYNSVLGIKSGVTAFLSIVTNNTTYAIASALAKQWSKIKKDNRETIKIIDEALKDKSIYPPPELMDRFVYAPIQGLLYLAGVSKLMPNYVSFKPITDYSEALKPILSEYVSEESFGDEKSLGTWIKDVYEEVKNREGFDKTKPIAEAVIETVAGILSTVMETPTRLLSLMNHVGITMFRNSFFRQSLYSNPLVTSAIKEIKDNEARVKFIQDLVAVDKTTTDEIKTQVDNEIQANNIPHWSRGVYKAQRTAELRESVILENEIGESVLQSVRANIALNGAQDLSVGKTAVAFEKFWQWVSKSKLVKYNYESKDAEDYNILDKIEDNIKQLVSSAVSFVVNGMLLFPLLSVRIFEGVKNTIPILGTVPLLLDFTQAINTGTYKRTTFIQGKDPITGQRSNEKTKQTFDVNLLSGDFINRVLLQVIGFSIATPLLSSFLSVTDDDEEKTFIMIDGAEAKMPMRFGETDAGFYFFTGEDKELKITRNNKDFVANSIMYYDKKTGKVSNEIPFRYKLLNTVIRNSLYNYMAQFAGDINNKSVFTKEYKRNILYNADTTEGQELLFKDRLSILPKDKSMVGINPNEGKITKDGHISANVVSFATNLLSSLYASTFSLMSDNIENTIENFSHLFDVATSNVDPDKNRDDGYTKFGTDEYYDRLSDDLIRQYGNGFQFMPKSVMKDLYGLKGIQYPNLKAMDFGDKFFNNITEPLRPFMRLSPDEVIYDTNIFGDVTLNNIPLFGQLGFKINPFIKNTNTGIIPKYKYDSDETRLFEAYVLDDYGNNVLIKNKRISRDNVINFLNYLSDTPIKVLNEALDHHNKKNYLSQLPIYIPNDLKPSYTTLAADEGDLIKTIPSNLRANYLKNYPVYAKAAAADEVYNSLFHIRKVELLPETDMRQTYFNKFATQTDMAETFSGNASSVKSEASKLAKLDMFYNIIADNGIMAKAVLSDRYEPIKRRNKLTDRQLTEYMLYGLNNSPLNLTEEEKKEFGDNEYIENFTGIKALNNFLKTHQVKINKNNITFLKQPKGKELINQEVISNPIYKTYPPVLIGVDFKKMEERLNVLSENMEYVKKTIEY